MQGRVTCSSLLSTRLLGKTTHDGFTVRPSTSSGSPIYLQNLQHNNRALYYVKSSGFLVCPSRACSPAHPPPSLVAATACIAGATAGLLGLTNLVGFAFFFLTALLVGGAFATVNCAGKPARYFVTAREPLVSGLLENLFSYVLFWTLFYSLVYIYD
ncbi:hypothetical protein JCM1841_001070 [Sporobolomyces salmonicolor]